MKKINSCDGIYKDSLDVRFTKACDNSCSFCIEACGLDALGKTNVDELIKNTIKSGKKEILILGGEPMLQVKKLAAYILGIREYVDKIFITTSLPATLKRKTDDLDYVLNTIDGLNVSLQHYDYVTNNEILNASNRFNRLDLLKSLLLDESLANKTRVSINLCGGYIDNKESLMIFLKKLETINCKHVKINELQSVDADLYVSYEKIMGIKMKTPYSNGCQFEISIPDVNMKITLKRSCFLVINDPSQADISVKDIIKVVSKKIKKPKGTCTVIYENGELSDGWQTKK